jgi:hypothetical protein
LCKLFLILGVKILKPNKIWFKDYCFLKLIQYTVGKNDALSLDMCENSLGKQYIYENYKCCHTPAI